MWTEEQPFPTDIIYRFEDVLESLNPDLRLAKNVQEAFSSLENLSNKVLTEISQLNQVSHIIFVCSHCKIEILCIVCL